MTMTQARVRDGYIYLEPPKNYLLYCSYKYSYKVELYFLCDNLNNNYEFKIYMLFLQVLLNLNTELEIPRMY